MLIQEILRFLLLFLSYRPLSNRMHSANFRFLHSSLQMICRHNCTLYPLLITALNIQNLLLFSSSSSSLFSSRFNKLCSQTSASSIRGTWVRRICRVWWFLIFLAQELKTRNLANLLLFLLLIVVCVCTACTAGQIVETERLRLGHAEAEENGEEKSNERKLSGHDDEFLFGIFAKS